MKYRPELFFTEDTGGASGAPAEPAAQESASLDSFTPPDGKEPAKAPGMERVEGEKLPDFSKLSTKKADETAETAKDTKKEEKPAGGQSGAKGKASKETSKPVEKPAKEEKSKQKEIPEPQESVTSFQTKETISPKILSDEEIDALQPKPGAPTHVVKDFQEMRAKLKEQAISARQAISEARTLRKEIEQVKSASGKIPEPIEKELAGLRQFHLLFNAQQDPAFQQEYDAKVTQSEEGVYSFLKQYGMKDEILGEIKKASDSGNIEDWAGWTALLDGEKGFGKTPILKQRLLNLLEGRNAAIRDRSSKLDQLGKDREGYFKTLEEKDHAEKEQWRQSLEKRAMEISDKAEWAMEKEIPANATADQKKALETHNAEVKAVAESFKNNVLGAYNRDPKITAEIAFAGVKASILEKQLAEVSEERDSVKERVKELEERLAKIKNAGRTAHVESPAVETGGRKSTTDGAAVGGDGSSAIHNWFANR